MLSLSLPLRRSIAALSKSSSGGISSVKFLPLKSRLLYSNFSSSNYRRPINNETISNDDHATSSLPHTHSLSNGRLKHRLRQGLPLTGVVTGQYRDTDHVEMLGLMGYDFLWADCEHSTASPDHVLNLIVAAERRGIPTLVRIGYGYQNIIGHTQKYMVAGAQGILLPQCESRENVKRVVEAVKFPPLGLRGLAGERWNAWGMARRTQQRLSTALSIAECVEEANRHSVVGVLVETRHGLEALEEILSVEELDLVFIAPTDLSSDLGLHGLIRHPQVLQLVEDTVNRIHRYNQEMRINGKGWHPVSVGTLAVSTDDYVYWRDRNVNVLCGVAQCMFVEGAKGFMDAVKEYEDKDDGSG
ncbi:pyruvate/phosphoenolpyruvate kinase-like domain containing protein [Nitzschia inconspicua]|uniref:Pyruvate/phosphoenolpyruvate kinase-like domain containing protein n=1 Tax=Nitzschia inconspicua TaxID=303405 RepID=A0A9K3M2W4_9STRA|nr:pyruvate/phosphoenolpyruvate kinase-like domain containing protein [Nitzschia inconspicua]